jgi:hypothetical protein
LRVSIRARRICCVPLDPYPLTLTIRIRLPASSPRSSAT